MLFDIDGTLIIADGVGRRALEIALAEHYELAVSMDGVKLAGRTDPLIVSDALRQAGLLRQFFPPERKTGLHAVVSAVERDGHLLGAMIFSDSVCGICELETVQVNGFYQGVVVPPGTEEVELRFLPLVRWAWVSQVAFALAWLAAGGRALARKRRNVSAA